MKIYKDWKISTKLIMGFLLIAVVTVIMGFVAVLNIEKLKTADQVLYSENTLGISYSSSAGTYFQRLRYNTLELTILDTAEKRQEVVGKIQGFTSTIDELLLNYKGRITHEEDQAVYDKVSAQWEDYKNYVKAICDEGLAGNIDRAREIIVVDSDESGTQLRKDLEELLNNNTTAAEGTLNKNEKLAMQTEITMYIVMGVSFLVSILLGIVIAKSISKPIGEIVAAADNLAIGDVEVELKVRSKDETGKLASSFAKMIENIRRHAHEANNIADGDFTVDVEVKSDKDILGIKLAEMLNSNNEVMGNIVTISEQIAAGAKQVADSSMALAQGATEQASAVEELTASLETISTQTDQNAKNANMANELAVNAKSNAVEGNNQMRGMLRAMEEINEASTSISKVIKVIDDIAFQTNILALNAAVEAARAGQHGKGFAVVAEEVRNLAVRSANAAKETTDMIEGSIKKTENGTTIARNTAEALSKIVTGIEKVATLVNDIAFASNEQAMGIAQINQGINQVSQVVQTNSATSEESASASEQLASQATILRDTVGRFRLKKNKRSNIYSEEVSPEVRSMLQNMVKGKTIQEEHPVLEDHSSTKKIILSDREFGKY